MNRVLSILALASLAACGGGGSGGGFLPIASAPAPKTAEPVVIDESGPTAPALVNPNCRQAPGSNRIDCDLISSSQAIGAMVPVGDFVTFTNRTDQHMQINEAHTYTGERRFWSEWCVYLDDGITGQKTPGVGEVGCSTKGVGEDYSPIHWGKGTGLIVPPGSVVTLNSNTQPNKVPHTYALKVQLQTAGLHSWRQPQIDKTFDCNGQMQTTEWSPWRNNTPNDVHMVGVSIYAESPSSKTPHKLNGPACIYVITADGQSVKYQNCDEAFTARGDVSFPLVTVAPGEFIVSQANNSCSQGGSNWDWAAWLRVW
jgi:hypothetical protein